MALESEQPVEVLHDDGPRYADTLSQATIILSSEPPDGVHDDDEPTKGLVRDDVPMLMVLDFSLEQQLVAHRKPKAAGAPDAGTPLQRQQRQAGCCSCLIRWSCGSGIIKEAESYSTTGHTVVRKI
ncbi:unnamed protein product [Heligmosomoides polygyrus]|uniref:Uncharacterized protein n=1 Tax=Heligmosomoides polygyrus TaxID=6339 RepID=A0A183FUC9_HELPZ|nr:unnamed protein product [Heligmosomoides polygyrus]